MSERTQEQLADLARKLAMTVPRRDRNDAACHETPYDQFRFFGSGPYYEFKLWPWSVFGAAAALNYFNQIGAVVVQHDHRLHSSDGEPVYYDYFLVTWQEAM